MNGPIMKLSMPLDQQILVELYSQIFKFIFLYQPIFFFFFFDIIDFRSLLFSYIIQYFLYKFF